MPTTLTPNDARVAAALAESMLPDGHGLRGAGSIDFAGRFGRRAATWEPRVAAQIAWLLRVWDLSPVLARRKRFTGLSDTGRREWVEDCYRSRRAYRRLHVSGLKQILYLVWASAPEVEATLGYDYSCRKDNRPRGAAMPVLQVSAPSDLSMPEPPNYARVGPAVTGGAIPRTRASVTGFAHRAEDQRKLETIHFPELSDGAVLTADVLVVGSGAGGAVAAATLAESGLDVIVVEEGFAVDDASLAGPPFERFQRFCRDDGTTQAWGMPPIPLPMGKVVGGTTVVNSGTCFRAPERVLSRWRDEFAVDDLSSGELQPYYEDVEEFLNVRPVPWDLLGPNGMAAHRGAVALGYSGGPLLRNITDCHGCGQCAFGCPTHAKQAMHVSYLPRAARAGARIVSGCRVDRVTTAGEVATGADATILDTSGRHRGSLYLKARQVVVCAGAVHTPALLMRSGIPDPSGQTGRNLRIHPATGVGGVMAAVGPIGRAPCSRITSISSSIATS